MNKLLALGSWAGVTALAAAVAGCGSGSSASDSATVTVNGDVPIAYAMRVNTISQNPTNGGPSAPGGDLMVREKSSASAIEHNITSQFTQGQGDAEGPDVSYDGKKIVFSMRCPTTSPAKIDGVAACTGRWNIWEYDMTTGGLTGGTFRRITSTADSDDVDPTYLPAGRGFVFSSNRQAKSSVNQALGHSYKALDEYERETVFNLHTMDAQGGNHAADLVQPEPRPQPDGAPERRHHVLALGPRRRPQPLQGLPRQARRHRPVRALRRAQRRQQLPAPARHGPEGQVRGPGRHRPDAALAHARRRRADVHRRRQLLRTEHAGEPERAGAGRPGRGDGAVAQLSTAACRSTAASPRRIRSGTAPTACWCRSRRARSRGRAWASSPVRR